MQIIAAPQLADGSMDPGKIMALALGGSALTTIAAGLLTASIWNTLSNSLHVAKDFFKFLARSDEHT